MTRPDDEYPPLDVTSTLHMGSLDDALEGADADVVPSRVAGSLPPGMALLVVRRGPNAGARFLLDHDVTTSGRHPDSDIFLDDVTVSRRHAEFHRGGSGFTVRDVGSLNGTYVNRERVESSSLSNGDEVQIGKFRLVFIAGPRLDDVT
jgi:pSer/pThr/pTyr-binding forkhead associated (FHA) protein